MKRIIFQLGISFSLIIFKCNGESLDAELFRTVKDEINLVNFAEQIINSNDRLISAECIQDLTAIAELSNFPWVWNLIDSSGKIPHGILKFNVYSIGQYKQCIDTVIRNEPSLVGGLHCVTHVQIYIPSITSMSDANRKILKLRQLSLKEFGADVETLQISENVRSDSIALPPLGIGLCLPSSCSAADINLVLWGQNITIVDNISANLFLLEESCTQTKKVELSAGDIVTITIFSIIGMIMLCSTLYDLWFQCIHKGDPKEQKQLFVAFSVYTNSDRLFTPSKNPGPLACLHGVRSLSLLWVVLGHRYFVFSNAPAENPLDMLKWTQEVSSSIITAGTVSVDSFLLMSGMLLSYTFFRSAKSNNAFRGLPLFYVHRIIRLTPLLAVVILIYATLLRHYGNGPAHHQIMVAVDGCRDYWWQTLLYVQNYMEKPNLCVGQTWYLAVDMHLYIISPLLLFPLLFHKVIGIIWVTLCILAAQATAFTIAYLNKWSASSMETEESYVEDYYVVTHTRATPYFIGLLAGYLLLKYFQKNDIKSVNYNFMKASGFSKFLIILGWACSLAVMGTVIFGFSDFNKPEPQTSQWASTLYLSLSRTGWSLGLLWVIVASALGYGGPISWFLSLKFWEIVGRFTYAVYLIHMAIQFSLVLDTNHIRLFAHRYLIVDFFGDVILAFSLAYVFIMAFESPITVLEKIIFKREKPKTVEIKPLETTVVQDDKQLNGTLDSNNYERKFKSA